MNTGSSGMGGGVSQASVTVGGNPATVNPDNTFVGYAQVKPNATTRVHIVASNVAGQVTDNYVDITPNILTPSVFAYDLNGDTTSAGPAGAPTATYGWDAADRLVTITQGSNVTKFDYDGEGRRVREWLNGTQLRQWVWCGLELCEERDASNNVTKRFYGQGEQIAGASYYFARDHLGSVREMTDASNVLHARYDYDLYGLPTANSVTVNPVATDFGFTGHYYHASSGLYLAPYRAYNASVGRWLSRDPIGEDGGINLYGYVGNGPVERVDLLGLDWRLPDFAQLMGAFPIPQIAGPFVGVQGGFSFAPDGSIYFTLGGGAGWPANAGLALTASWICQKAKPSNADIDNFLKGWGWNVAGGLGLTGQFSGNFSGQTALGGGVGVRGAGVGVGYTWQIVSPP